MKTDKSYSNLAGKVAFVTGGSRSIGAAIVRRLTAEGVSVAFTYHGSPEQAAALVAEIESRKGIAFAIKADSSSPVALKKAVSAANRAFGAIHILVNNAGILGIGPLESYSLEAFDKMLATNVRAVFVASQAVASQMPDGGRIVTIGSVNADTMPFAGGSVYAMTKAAVAGFGRGLARDLGARGITVNTLQPGPVDTDMNPADGPMAPSLKSRMALGRYGTPEEIAGLVAFLISDQGGFITGASITIDGGFSA
jgi:3-oxoacyl-[acyl-carrier protein] reductase